MLKRAKKLRKLSKQHSRQVTKVARYKKKMYNNKKLMENMDRKISSINANDIAQGKAFMDSAFN